MENSPIGVYAALQCLADTGLDVTDSYSVNKFKQSHIARDWFDAQKASLSGGEVLVFLGNCNNICDLQIDWAYYDTPSRTNGNYYFVCKINRSNLYEELKQYVLKVQEVNRNPELLLTFDFMKEKDVLVSNMEKPNENNGKARKLQGILVDKRIQEHTIYYAEFEGNFKQFKINVTGDILGYNDVLFYLMYKPETDKYEVNFTTDMLSENLPSTVYFAMDIDISDREYAVIKIVKYLDDVSRISSLYMNEHKSGHEEVNEDDFDCGESTYIHYIDDVISSLESQIKDTKDKSQKLLLENAVKNLKAWIILAE